MANDRRVGNLLVQMRTELGQLKLDVQEMDRTFKTGFQGIQTSAANAFKAVGASIAGAFTVSAIVGFGRQVINLAGQLQDLQDQTGVSAQLLSGMKSTLEEAGTSVEAFAKGIFTAQRNLGQIRTGTEPAAIAIRTLGLNLDELRNSTPDKFLETIADALAKIDNPVQRAAVGADLLGRSFQSLAPVLGQVSGRLAELKAQGMNAEDIKRLDEFGDSWTRLGNRLQILASGPLTALITGFERLFNLTDSAKLNDELAKTAAQIQELDKQISVLQSRKSAGLGGIGIGGATNENELLARRNELTKKIIDLNDKLIRSSPTKSATQEPFKPPPDTDKKNEGDSFLASLQKQTEALKANIVEQIRGSDAAKALGIAYEAAAVKAKLLAEGKPIPGGFDQQIQDFIVQIEALSQELREAKFEAESFAAAAKRDSQDSAEWLTFAQDIAKVREEMEKAAKAWGDMRLDQLGAAFDQDSQEFFTANEGIAAEMKRQADEANAIWNSFADTFESTFDRSLNAVLTSTEDWGERMKHLAANIGFSIIGELQKAFVLNPLMDLLLGNKDKSGNRSGGLIDTGIKALSALFAGFFDEGGIVPGRIGEPRLAVVHAGETISPTHKTSGFGNNVVYNIDARGAQRGVSAEIRRAIAMSQQETVQQSVAAVNENRKRSRNFAKTFRS